LVVNLRLGMIGPQVALAAHFGLPRHRFGEGVAAVTRRARSRRTVEVDAPHAGIWPRRRVEHRGAHGVLSNLAVGALEDGDGRAVALPAAVHGGELPLDDLAQNVVERTNEFRGLRVMTALILRDDVSVTAGAGVGRQDRGDRFAFVNEGARLLL